MNKFCAIWALLAIILLPWPATAQENTSTGTNIAVVDVRYILGKSDAGKSIHKQRKDIHAKFLAEISKTEKALRKEEQALIKSREKTSSEDFLIKKQKYERSLLETGRAAREKKQALDTMFSAAMTRLQESLMEIIQKIASEQRYDLVITKQNVIIGAESLDITGEAMTRLNKALPDIKLKKQ